MSESCVFCEIIKGQRPVMKIFEDESTLAFLDHSNDVFGHTLVIPKEHVSTIIDCELPTLTEVMKTVKEVSMHYVTNSGFSGVNILNANGTSAQQSIAHFHVHLIPRKVGDSIDAWPNFKKNSKTLLDAHNQLQMEKSEN